MSLTVLLPTYNEAENINPLIRAIKKHAPNAAIIVVDDNSPDGTASMVKNATVIRRTKNRGLTNSLKDGIKAAKTDLVGWMDCDFSHPPELIPKLLKTRADIAIAKRKIYPALSRVINVLCQFLFGWDIHDYTTGFLVAKRDVLKNIDLRGNYGEYCIDLLVRAKRMGYSIVEVSYTSPPRRAGYSKTSLLYGYWYVLAVLKLATQRLLPLPHKK